MKKMLAIVLILAMVVSMVACGDDEKPKESPTPTAELTPTAEPEEPSSTPTTAATATPTPTPDLSYLHESEFDSLQEAYKDDFMIGTIYTTNVLNGKDKELVLKEFNVMTPENIMKPEGMQPTEGKFNYGAADRMMSFAKENNVTIIGHTLAWHQQSGKWLGSSAANRDEAIAQLKAHIEGVAGHYKGQIYSWDVVNEAIRDGAKLPENGDWTQCLRETQWTKSIGLDYIALAFQFAHEAAPDALLYYNDYNMDNANKAEIAAAMIKDLREQGVPIHGIGMQGHYSTGTSLSNVGRSLERFSQIEGLRISVTELDVTINGVNNGKPSKEQQMLQAVFYAKLFKLYKEYADVIERVTFWGYRDNTSWRSEGAPLLFDAMLNPKEAYYAVLNPEAYAALGGEEAKPETKKAEAVYGTPTVDGTIDACWNDAKTYEISNAIFAWQGAKGTVQMMWDENNLYALIRVKDGVLNASNGNLYEQDSIEFFLDQNNCKKEFYDSACGQYRCSYKGVVSYGEVPTTKDVKMVAAIENGGYLVELSIPLVKAGEKGTVMGFDAQINDANASGTRQSVMKFNGTSDSDYTNPSTWAEVTFK